MAKSSNSETKASAKSKTGGQARNITRAIVGAILVVLLIVAGLDYRAKSQWQASYDDAGSRLSTDGFPVAELSTVIHGSPTVTGNPQTDTSVTYQWKFLRTYEMTIRIEGSGEKRYVTQAK